MPTAPAVSIIVPTYNDEAWVAAALESCIRQTAQNIEIICVDDASTDGTPSIIESFRARDSRIRLIGLDVNGTAFQARRIGVEAASAPYVLFLDGDDELVPQATKVALKCARKVGADVVGFGVHVIMPDGTQRSSLENALQPSHDRLSGEQILPALFPPEQSANGHLWRYLLKTELIRKVYAGFPRELPLPRANDLPISFLTLAAATTYVSTPERLYRYYFRRGTSGHHVLDLDRFEFYLGAVNSVELIQPRLHAVTRGWGNPHMATACYESARLSVIGNVLRYCMSASDPELQDACMALLRDRVGYVEIVRAAANFRPDALAVVARAFKEPVERRLSPHRVLLTSANLGTGGVQGVVASQARYLLDAGFKVMVAVQGADEAAHNLPEGVAILHIEGENPADRIASWISICEEFRADVIIDHHILYNRRWPFLVLAARTLGIPTIGWLHNFALRPLFDNGDNATFLTENLPLLEAVVTLSPTDVAYWKLRGITRVVWLPNPPSPTLLLELSEPAKPKPAPTGEVKIVWWGRLQESTKRVRSLIPITSTLRDLGVDARLTIIGPDSPDLTGSQLLEDAFSNGIGDAVQVLGPLHGQALINELSSAHMFVSTSAIEGAPLTLVEAQALGLPIAMYELPWLAGLEGNGGVVTAAQGDVHTLARQIADLVGDPERYSSLSAAALAAAQSATDFDFSGLYGALIRGNLPAEYSPEPSLSHASLLLEWSTRYAEANARYSRRRRREITSLQAEVRVLRKQLAARSPRTLAIRVAGRARRWSQSLRPQRGDHGVVEAATPQR